MDEAGLAKRPNAWDSGRVDASTKDLVLNTCFASICIVVVQIYQHGLSVINLLSHNGIVAFCVKADSASR
jgi:hypothetical protein